MSQSLGNESSIAVSMSQSLGNEPSMAVSMSQLSHKISSIGSVPKLSGYGHRPSSYSHLHNKSFSTLPSNSINKTSNQLSKNKSPKSSVHGRIKMNLTSPHYVWIKITIFAIQYQIFSFVRFTKSWNSTHMMTLWHSTATKWINCSTLSILLMGFLCLGKQKFK